MKPRAAYLREARLPAMPASLDAVHDLVERLWTRLDRVDPAVRLRFETAVAEVAGNIIEHCIPSPGATGVTLAFAVEADEASLRGVFVDDGREVDVDLAVVRMPDVEAEDGRGLALAMALCDSVRYERAGSTNRWTLVCHRANEGLA